jgi:hypothetical protein
LKQFPDILSTLRATSKWAITAMFISVSKTSRTSAEQRFKTMQKEMAAAVTKHPV